MLVLILRAPVWNPVAGVAVCANMLGRIAVPMEMHAVAPQPPQHVGSKADEHDANRGFEGLREHLGDSPAQHDRSACEMKTASTYARVPRSRPCLTMSATLVPRAAMLETAAI